MNANWVEWISGAWEWVIRTSLESSLLLAFVILISRISTSFPLDGLRPLGDGRTAPGAFSTWPAP